MDRAGYVLDENTGLAPHNMDPPKFVTQSSAYQYNCNFSFVAVGGALHEPEFQRLIPGNDLIIAVGVLLVDPFFSTHC
jgi:hypothetical protein